MTRFASAITLVLACAACSSSSGGSEADKGAAPNAKDFTLSPANVAVGKAQTLMGSITLEDADGDLATLYNQVRPPDGSTQPISESSLSALANKTAATVPMQLAMPALPVAGDYVVSVWAKDKAGNESGKVTMTITAK